MQRDVGSNPTQGSSFFYVNNSYPGNSGQILCLCLAYNLLDDACKIVVCTLILNVTLCKQPTLLF